MKKRFQSGTNRFGDQYVQGNGPTVWECKVIENQWGEWDLMGNARFCYYGESEIAKRNNKEYEEHQEQI